MRSFSFRLETLLRLRKNSRDRALADYAKAIEQREFAQSKIAEIEDYLAELDNKKNLKVSHIFSVNEMILLQSQIEKAQEIKSKQLKNLSRCIGLESSRKKIFLQKEAEFKSLEKFKDRKAEEHIVFERNKEEKEQEDIISARFVYDRVSS